MTVNFSSSGKRTTDFSSLSPEEQKPKRLKSEVQSSPPLMITPIINKDDYFTETNCVRLHPLDFNHLFSKGSIGAPPVQNYVQLGNRVFKVLFDESKFPGHVEINHYQNEAVKETIQNIQGRLFCLVTPFFWNQDNSSRIKKIHFTIHPTELFKSMQNPTLVSRMNLKDHVRKVFLGSYFKLSQCVQINFGSHSFKLKVDDLELQSPPQLGQSYFGYFYRQTSIKIKTTLKNKILLTNQVPPVDILYLTFQIECSPHDNEKANFHKQSLPYLFTQEGLRQRIMEKLRNKSIPIGHKFTISDGSNPSCVVTLDSVQFVDKKQGHRVKGNVIPVYTLVDNKGINFKHTRDIIILVDVEPRPMASHATFTVVRADPYSTFDGTKNNFIPIEELIAKIRERAVSESFVFKQNFDIHLENGYFSLEVHNLSNPLATDFQKKNARRIKWNIDANTAFNFKMNASLGMTFVDKSSPEHIEELTLKIHYPKSMLFSTFASEKKSPPQSLMKEDELKQLFKDVLPATLLDNDMWLSHDKDGKLIEFSVASCSFVNKTLPNSIYKRIGTITPDSKITFQVKENGGLTLIRDVGGISYMEAKEKIHEMGLGGLGAEFEKIFRDILMSRGPYREIQKKLGIQPPRGLLLYGPPGTGKTTLARNVGKVLGCDGECFKKIAGASVWNKYVGESEKFVRDLFAPARAAWKKYGEQSPLFVIVIDEIEAVLSARQEDSKRWETSVVDQFLAELDGADPVNNILVIGLTNHIDRLDPALRRAGRFDTEVELKYPDTSEKRREILEIHMKGLREEKMLDDNVRLEDIAEATDGFSGADLEGMVRKACSYPLERLSKKESNRDNPVRDLETLLLDPDTKIGRADIKKAIEEIKERKKNQTPPQGMYI